MFKPATAYRLRRNQNTDTPLPPEVPAGQNPPDGCDRRSTVFDLYGFAGIHIAQCTAEAPDGAAMRILGIQQPAVHCIDGMRFDPFVRASTPTASLQAPTRLTRDSGRCLQLTGL
ncbi:MAG: hypothetical protein AUG74_19725 [Bacteroidetes bacterium 13_1_20CM_4_60_6]|nr:MAG: hypothetical protein AUG74_19725 [Bacteroidetes bacterium 13_1_20CM_4_60_6]